MMVFLTVINDDAQPEFGVGNFICFRIESVGLRKIRTFEYSYSLLEDCCLKCIVR